MKIQFDNEEIIGGRQMLGKCDIPLEPFNDMVKEITGADNMRDLINNDGDIEIELKERFINKIINLSANYISLFVASYKGLISAYMIAGKDLEKLIKEETEEISK